MKKHNPLSKPQMVFALTLIALSPVFGADASPANAASRAEAKADKAEVVADGYKASLDEINTRIDAIEARLDAAPEGAGRLAAEQRLDALKERRGELRKHYIKAKADALVADLKIEYTKVTAWTKDAYESVKETIAGDDADTKSSVVPTAQAAVNANANTALANIELYRLNPSPENKADVKKALKALDKEIDRLDDRADELSKGEKRDALKQRIKALEKRERELKHEFTSARWDALLDDLRDSWNSLVD